MVVDANGNYDLAKMNLYRVGVNQLTVNSVNDPTADTKLYCKHMLQTGAPRILIDMPFTIKFASPDPANAANLFDFLVMRFDASLTNLNCLNLLGLNNTPLDIQGQNSTSSTRPLNLIVDQGLLAQVMAMPPDPNDVNVHDYNFATQSSSTSRGVTLHIGVLAAVSLTLAIVA